MRTLIFVILTISFMTAAWAQMRPPTITSVTPHGAKRGTTVTLTVNGTNLGEANQILFDTSGLSGKILNISDVGPDKVERKPDSTAAPIEDRARKNQLTIEMTVGPDTPIGKHNFRIQTPLGTTSLGTIHVGALPEVDEKEPNNGLTEAQKITPPVTVNGTIEMANDSDYYRFQAKPGQQFVFEIVAAALQSSLDATLTLLDEKGNVLASNDDFNEQSDSVLAYTFTQAGAYIIRVSDALSSGSKRHFYRLTVGELPYVTGVFPLGVRRGATTELTLEGFNLGAQKIKANPLEVERSVEIIPLPMSTPKGGALNKVKVALGDYPEVMEQEPNDDLKTAQPVTFPVTINGRIDKEKGGADQDLFRFKAKKGQRIVFSVMAQRLGSLLDSVIEILDVKGNEVPRATLRPVWQTTTTLRDHDSLGRGIRLDSCSGIRVGDFLLLGNELLQVAELPKSPDDDTKFRDFRGRRIAFEDTTAEAHALNSPVYKVEIHKPGAEFPPNGMPVVRLTYRNDDGDPMYGKDSHLTFTAPEDGSYFVRIKDVRGQSGKHYAYRLTIAEPDPDFTLFVSPINPNVPRGGRVPVTVTAYRKDGFDDRIDVRMTDLPQGLEATSGAILPGEDSVVLTLSAPNNAILSDPIPLRVVGKAQINGREVSHYVNLEEMEGPVSRIALSSPPELYVASVEPQQIQIEPGGQAKVTVKIQRTNGFAGRVPLSVRNLPFLTTVPNIGLNGILITEQEDSRSFYIHADPKAEPCEQTLYVTGRVETNSSLPTDQASVPIRLKILPKQARASR